MPGGRFNEIYYWDSYFTMQGLEESGRHDLTMDMIANFGWLIDQFGHIPNGNRSYFLSRSQPPFFAAMIELAADEEGETVYKKYLPQLIREYQFWMDGADALKPGSAHRRAVKLADGTVLNRYYDDRNVPREEAYKEDVATAKVAGPGSPEIYRNLRAAAESGWDFSSRWFAGKTLATIHTTDLIPPDLNSSAVSAGADHRQRLRSDRRPGVRCRHEGQGCVETGGDDEVFVERQGWRVHRLRLAREDSLNSQVTAATVYPLYFKVASKEQGKAVASTVRSTLLKPHGVATTIGRHRASNGMSQTAGRRCGGCRFKGLKNYGEDQLAATIAQRWVGKEPAGVQGHREAGREIQRHKRPSGRWRQYPLQDGFGWTNGVLRKLLAMYQNLPNETFDACLKLPVSLDAEGSFRRVEVESSLRQGVTL